MVLEKIAQEQRGLILCTGTTGSGKSTSLAAMIDYINSQRTEHIITIEDPIEFLHRDKKSIVNQREVEVDTRSFAAALRSALRQDPDVILVGEMRDYETIETAITAAETGHLVFSTLHTLDATETINRIISVFPPHQQKQIRLQLSGVLKAVISMRLVPRADGHGRVPAVEVMIATPFIRDCIINKDKTKLIHEAIAAGVSPVRDADLRPVDLPALQEGADHLRRGAAPRQQPRRVQAQDPGHPVHLRHGGRGDGEDDAELRRRDLGPEEGSSRTRRTREAAYAAASAASRGATSPKEEMRRALARAGYEAAGGRGRARPADRRTATSTTPATPPAWRAPGCATTAWAATASARTCAPAAWLARPRRAGMAEAAGRGPGGGDPRPRGPALLAEPHVRRARGTGCASCGRSSSAAASPSDLVRDPPRPTSGRAGAMPSTAWRPPRATTRPTYRVVDMPHGDVGHPELETRA